VKRRSYRSMADINVTNLVDVVLVLLIVFMITAPLLQSGINVDLPATQAGDETTAEGMIITITDNNAVFIDDHYVDMRHENEFADRVKAGMSKLTKQVAYLRADVKVSYGTVVDILNRLRILGVTNVSLVTEPGEGK
jgi:biopolymer transport protein TolR